MANSNHVKRRRAIAFAIIALVMLLGTALWKMNRVHTPSSAAQSEQTNRLINAQPSPPSKSASMTIPNELQGGAAGMSGARSRAPITPIPALGTRAKRRVWLRSKYGDGEEQLGFYPIPEGGEGEARVPQGFVVTPDGDLLVLDSEKRRLVWFDPTAQIKRKVSLDTLVLPADVGIAADGTIAVMDHRGVQTKGTLLLTPEGKSKGMLPQSGAPSAEMYIVGNDILSSSGGSSIKLGETSGVPSHETTHIYQQDGTIPGQVAPDGRTVLDAGIEDRDEGRFFISVLRNDPPEHLYTRQYRVPVKEWLFGISYLQADRLGTAYIVLDYDDFQSFLLCFDLETGDPLGAVRLADDYAMAGAAFKQFAVNREQGGLIYHHLLDGVSSFEIYDCR